MASESISTIAHLVLRGLSQTRHRPGNPVRGPSDQLIGIDDRQSKQFYGLRRVGEPRRRLLRAGDDGLAAETLAELRSEVAHGQNFMAADIDRRGRRVAMREAAQRLRRGIALPDEIDMAEADVDRRA